MSAWQAPACQLRPFPATYVLAYLPNSCSRSAHLRPLPKTTKKYIKRWNKKEFTLGCQRGVEPMAKRLCRDLLDHTSIVVVKVSPCLSLSTYDMHLKGPLCASWLRSGIKVDNSTISSQTNLEVVLRLTQSLQAMENNWDV